MNEKRFAFVLALLVGWAIVPALSQNLYLYGGQDHKQFLGCANCNEFAADSIWNEFGTYGSEFSSTSIWNDFSPWGSDFSPESPFNNFATDPPAIVDQTGNFYGYFTSNTVFPNRTKIPFFVWLSENRDTAVKDFSQIGSQF